MNKTSLVSIFILSLMTTCRLEARSPSPESIIPGINDYTIVKASPCNPPDDRATRMCLIIEKDGKQLMSIHDIETKQPLQIRDGQKIVWSHTWEVV